MILSLLCELAFAASPRTLLLQDLGDTPSPQFHGGVDDASPDDASPNVVKIQGQIVAEQMLQEKTAALEELAAKRNALSIERNTLEQRNQQVKLDLTAALESVSTEQQMVKKLKRENEVLLKRFALTKRAAELTDEDLCEFVRKFERLAEDLAAANVVVLGTELNAQGNPVMVDGQPKTFNRVDQLKHFIRELSVSGTAAEIKASLRDPGKKEEAAKKIFTLMEQIKIQIQ